ncbi:Uma2 family endonuclease [Saccharothrix sp. MB29]|nr:Uma2 family endonuclease [Saccharothrix sp. MB29]
MARLRHRHAVSAFRPRHRTASAWPATTVRLDLHNRPEPDIIAPGPRPPGPDWAEPADVLLAVEVVSPNRRTRPHDQAAQAREGRYRPSGASRKTIAR